MNNGVLVVSIRRAVMRLGSSSPCRICRFSRPRRPLCGSLSPVYRWRGCLPELCLANCGRFESRSGRFSSDPTRFSGLHCPHPDVLWHLGTHHRSSGCLANPLLVIRALRVSRAMPAEAHRKPAVCAWTPGRSGLTGEDGEEVADFLAASERIG